MALRGIAFPFTRSSESFPAVATEEEVVADSVRRILATSTTEVPMREDQGSKIWNMIFENTGSILRVRIRDEVFRVIGQQEKRVAVKEVIVEEKKGDVEVTVLFEYRGSLYRTSITMERS